MCAHVLEAQHCAAAHPNHEPQTFRKRALPLHQEMSYKTSLQDTFQIKTRQTLCFAQPEDTLSQHRLLLQAAKQLTLP